MEPREKVAHCFPLEASDHAGVVLPVHGEAPPAYEKDSPMPEVPKDAHLGEDTQGEAAPGTEDPPGDPPGNGAEEGAVPKEVAPPLEGPVEALQVVDSLVEGQAPLNMEVLVATLCMYLWRLF